MNTNIIHVKLLACRLGVYTQYVFQNLDDKSYIMCTKLPNWQVPEIQIGDTGFLEYQEVKSGDQYFDPTSQQMMYYNYSNIYFINFIQKTDIIQNNEIIL